MTTRPSRRVPEEAAATHADITAAIESLTEADWARLKRFADIRIFRLGPKADGRTGDDLIQIALTDLLEDTRRWNKNEVTFVMWLVGAMRSISSNWARSYKKEKNPVVEADLVRENEEGQIFSPLEAIPDPSPGPAKQLRDKETLGLIDDMFKDDEQAQMVLTAWQEGYDPAGVRELWDLSQNDYNTIVRRIRRRLATSGVAADHDTGGN
jgi:DNA-directed RNA polymerase specialized sigma24 family protein